jgi:HEAT repeat protein
MIDEDEDPVEPADIVDRVADASSPGASPPAASGEGKPSEDVSFGRTLLQFFIIPAFVVAICVGVFFFFAWLVSDEKTGIDYLNEVRSGSANRRWQAAFELSKIITMDSEKRRLEGLVPEMVEAFEQGTGDDPRVRHYLALSLGHLGDDRASPALIAALRDPDATTRLYSCWALGNIGSRQAVAPLLERFDDDDPGVRKMAVYAAGAIGDRSALARLQAALSDPVRDVSWNAAIALAKLGDRSGETMLLQMLDPGYLREVEGMDEVQKLLATEAAIKAAALLGGETLNEKLREIGKSHPNLGLQKAALEALEGGGAGRSPPP